MVRVLRVQVIVAATDEVGLVQAITAAATEHEGNVTGASLSVIEGYATVVAHIELVPSAVDPRDRLSSMEASVDRELKHVYSTSPARRVVHMKVNPVPDLGSGRTRPHNRLRRGLRCGADSGDAPGMLHIVAEGLASRKISIIDMQTRVFSIGGRSECAMHFEIQLPGAPDGDVEALVLDLEAQLGGYFIENGIAWSGRLESLQPHPYWDGYDEPGDGDHAVAVDA